MNIQLWKKGNDCVNNKHENKKKENLKQTKKMRQNCEDLDEAGRKAVRILYEIGRLHLSKA